MKRIEWTSRGRRDLEFAYQTYREQSEARAASFKHRLQDQLLLIERFPYIGMATGRDQGFRKFRLNQHYYFVYEPTVDSILIHGILPYWKDSTSYPEME